MSCPCDTLIHPRPLSIAAGLTTLPRQIAGFPEFRTALLAGVRRHPALAAWRARDQGDLGLMLLEMWAVLCDAVSFYDQVHAQGAYLRTAQREQSVRALVDLLGYVPRPAVAAQVELALYLDGNHPVTLPAGTAFRSEAFDGEAPQVFELLEPTTRHPWNNRWSLVAPRPVTALEGPGTSATALHVVRKGATLRAGDVVLVAPSATSDANTRPRRVTAVEPADDASLLVRFSSALTLNGATALAEIRLLRATRSTGLWLLPYEAGSVNPIDATLTELVLAGLNRDFRADQRVVLERSGELRWFSVKHATEVQQKVLTGTDADGNNLFGWVPATRITLDAALNAASRSETGTSWSTADAALITVHHGLQPAATATAPAATSIDDTDALVVAAPILTAELDPPGRFVLSDARDRAVIVGGALDPATRVLSRDGGDPGWDGSLTLPVEVSGNVITAVRGQTVAREVLGSGDRSLANQRFVLKKSPLTYLGAETASGVASSLELWVEGVRWTEIASFFGAGPEDPVYVVRLDADGVATVVFGDGIHGARLPTGSGNVVAAYRYGAGAAAPPARSIHQIAKPVRGLSRVAQPEAATGGADAEGADNVRTYAPRSALVLGRAVSILDLQALASTVPGVRSAQTTWGWHGVQQRPVVQCWYAGSASEGSVAARLRSMTDPTTPIAASPAKALLAALSLQVRIDDKYVADDVNGAIFDVLGAAKNGFLRPESLGIGQPLYRSKLSAAVLSVPGALAVHFSAMLWLDASGALRSWRQDGYGARPGTGAYFDFERGAVWLNGKVHRLG